MNDGISASAATYMKARKGMRLVQVATVMLQIGNVLSPKDPGTES